MRLIAITGLLRLCHKNSVQRAYRHSGKFSEIATALYHQMVDGACFESAFHPSATQNQRTLLQIPARILRIGEAETEQKQLD